MDPGYQAYDVEKDELSMHVPAFTLNARPQLVHPTNFSDVAQLENPSELAVDGAKLRRSHFVNSLASGNPWLRMSMVRSAILNEMMRLLVFGTCNALT